MLGLMRSSSCALFLSILAFLCVLDFVLASKLSSVRLSSGVTKTGEPKAEEPVLWAGLVLWLVLTSEPLFNFVRLLPLSNLAEVHTSGRSSSD